ncbi:regulatory protein RecX [Thalassotalea sp. M1531]|uniref:Regulatory protein RecX n=1 Tax=Thalassotalea algicola TaxID=2716224 RepID=A0A7Y0LCR9_9GAMM|nr:regulatory protein RecX [Thalassotalea algicola]NMP32205.1 regulatory protein RecX [Thalassotalea algicola]
MNKEILHSAIGLLSRREHSEKELTQKLKVKQHPLDEIAPVIDYLVENNYLSNIRFAESVIRNKVNRGYGWQYIKQALKSKGIKREIYLAVLEEQSIDWYQQAQEAYQKRFGSSEILDQKDKAKRLRFLQYRGYSIDECMAALNTDYID